MPKHNDLFHIPSGRYISLVHLFLLLVQLLSKSCYLFIDVLQEGENVVNKEVIFFFLFQLLQASLYCPVTSQG